jgi:uncharacterized Ntn-hydrolase superfamily protein
VRALTTFSIVGRSSRTGQLGVAVSTADVGAGRLVTWAKAGVGAVATQSWPSLYLAIDALRLMQEGSSATDALAKVLADDPGRSVRQVGIVDRHGGSATFSGDECTTWYGGINGPDFAAQGNMLIRGDTVSAMAASFLATADLDLSERLVQALEAGQAAGGDKRGRQSAALYLVSTEVYPYLDIRVDDNPDPVVELRRLYEESQAEYLPFKDKLPTRANPHGIYGKALTEAIIAEQADRDRARTGVKVPT